LATQIKLVGLAAPLERKEGLIAFIAAFGIQKSQANAIYLYTGIIFVTKISGRFLTRFVIGFLDFNVHAPLFLSVFSQSRNQGLPQRLRDTL